MSLLLLETSLLNETVSHESLFYSSGMIRQFIIIIIIVFRVSDAKLQ